MQLFRSEELPSDSVFDWYNKNKDGYTLLMKDTVVLILEPHRLLDGNVYNIHVRS